MLYLLILTALLVVAGIGLNLQQSRAASRKERAAALERVAAVQARVAERVVALFDAVAEARGGARQTAAAFAAVEQAFRRASDAYAQAARAAERVQELAGGTPLSQVRQEAAAAAQQLEAVLPLLDDLEAQLMAFRHRQEEAPRRVQEARERLSRLEAELQATAATLGLDLPLARQVAQMCHFLGRVEAELQGGNPIGALQKAEDLAISLENLAGELATYRSAAAALAQARDEVTALAAGTGTAPLLDQARRILAELPGHLAAGRLDHFQSGLLALQDHLRQARSKSRELGRRSGIH